MSHVHGGVQAYTVRFRKKRQAESTEKAEARRKKLRPR